MLTFTELKRSFIILNLHHLFLHILSWTRLQS